MLNKKLKLLIIERYGTAADAAQDLGIHPSQLSAIMRNRRTPSERDRQAFLRVFTADEIGVALMQEERK